MPTIAHGDAGIAPGVAGDFGGLERSAGSVDSCRGCSRLDLPDYMPGRSSGSRDRRRSRSGQSLRSDHRRRSGNSDRPSRQKHGWTGVARGRKLSLSLFDRGFPVIAKSTSGGPSSHPITGRARYGTAADRSTPCGVTSHGGRGTDAMGRTAGYRLRPAAGYGGVVLGFAIPSNRRAFQSSLTL